MTLFPSLSTYEPSSCLSYSKSPVISRMFPSSSVHVCSTRSVLNILPGSRPLASACVCTDRFSKSSASATRAAQKFLSVALVFHRPGLCSILLKSSSLLVSACCRLYSILSTRFCSFVSL